MSRRRIRPGAEIGAIILLAIVVYAVVGLLFLSSAARASTEIIIYDPRAYRVFCQTHPDAAACEYTPERVTVELTDKLYKILYNVNADVNWDIRPRVEPVDVWSLNPAYGDCEDYALTKMQRLRSRGVPMGALAIAHVRTRDGVSHATLVVNTTRGVLSLDNLAGNTINSLRWSGHKLISYMRPGPVNGSIIMSGEF